MDFAVAQALEWDIDEAAEIAAPDEGLRRARTFSRGSAFLLGSTCVVEIYSIVCVSTYVLHLASRQCKSLKEKLVKFMNLPQRKRRGVPAEAGIFVYSTQD